MKTLSEIIIWNFVLIEFKNRQGLIQYDESDFDKKWTSTDCSQMVLKKAQINRLFQRTKWNKAGNS